MIKVIRDYEKFEEVRFNYDELLAHNFVGMLHVDSNRGFLIKRKGGYLNSEGIYSPIIYYPRNGHYDDFADSYIKDDASFYVFKTWLELSNWINEGGVNG